MLFPVKLALPPDPLLAMVRLPGVPGTASDSTPLRTAELPRRSRRLVAEPSTMKFWLKSPPVVSTCSVPPVKAGITVEPTLLRK